MKTLEGYTICYDGVCPMCNLYTRTFVRSGMLDAQGRETYQQLPEPLARHIDRERAVNEIALVNRQTGEVRYGIDSLFAVIGHSFPFLQPLFRQHAFHWLMTRAYRFISYNRRVIVPSALAGEDGDQPAFHRTYRIAYLLVSWLITAWILSGYTELLEPLLPGSRFYREFLICGGQVIWQGCLIRAVRRERSWDYLGNMMTVSLAGGLALLPGLLLGSWLQAPYLFAAYFVLVAGCMFLEHGRRMRLLGLGWGMTISWVLYRILLLILILFI